MRTNCEHCAFFEQYDEAYAAYALGEEHTGSDGDCHRYPPSIWPEGEGLPPWDRFSPWVNGRIDWCGEFRPFQMPPILWNIVRMFVRIREPHRGQ